MAATLELQDDTRSPITAWPFGAVADGGSEQFKFFVANVGDSNALSTTISIQTISQNDGINFVQLAPDLSGNPGTFSPNPLVLGTLGSGVAVAFWVKTAVGNGVTPQGNPRYFKIGANWSGT